MTYRYRTIKRNGKTKLLHRHLVEKRIGRRLRGDEEVHHRNEDRFDNTDANLEVLLAAEHRALHGLARRKHPFVKSCTVCGAEFTPRPTKRHSAKTCSAACANIQRSRSEKATKRRRVAARPLADAPLLTAAE